MSIVLEDNGFLFRFPWLGIVIWVLACIAARALWTRYTQKAMRSSSKSDTSDPELHLRSSADTRALIWASVDTAWRLAPLGVGLYGLALFAEHFPTAPSSTITLKALFAMFMGGFLFPAAYAVADANFAFRQLELGLVPKPDSVPVRLWFHFTSRTWLNRALICLLFAIITGNAIFWGGAIGCALATLPYSQSKPKTATFDLSASESESTTIGTSAHE